jgi:hypothetical protein
MKLPELKELPTQELVDRLTAERDALVEQVRQLRAHVEDMQGLCLTSGEVNEIKARAVEDAADYAAGLISDKYGIATSGAALEILNHKTDVVFCVAEYANQLRQQASK